MSYGDLPYMGRVDQSLYELCVVRGGLPARILGNPHTKGRCAAGHPSHTTDDGFLVYEFMVAMHTSLDHNLKLIPLHYNTDCLISNFGTVPLHHGVEAEWKYRPNLYELIMEPGEPEWNEPIVGWQQMGSQRELQYRQGLHETVLMKDEVREAHESGDEAAMQVAQARWFMARWEEQRAIVKADELLESMLAPTQLYELRIWERFRCVGGATGRYYEVELGNGFAEVEPDTSQTTKNYCYHPDSYLPDGDIALATKLNLEDPDLEEDFVSGANMSTRKPKLAHRDAQARFDRATAMERELIAA